VVFLLFSQIFCVRAYFLSLLSSDDDLSSSPYLLYFLRDCVSRVTLDDVLVTYRSSTVSISSFLHLLLFHSCPRGLSCSFLVRWSDGHWAASGREGGRGCVRECPFSTTWRFWKLSFPSLTHLLNPSRSNQLSELAPTHKYFFSLPISTSSTSSSQRLCLPPRNKPTYPLIPTPFPLVRTSASSLLAPSSSLRASRSCLNPTSPPLSQTQTQTSLVSYRCLIKSFFRVLSLYDHPRKHPIPTFFRNLCPRQIDVNTPH